MKNKQQRGQGMTEYIIIVALIAIAAIGTFTLFGGVVRDQTATMAAELGGNKEKAKRASESATKRGGQAADLSQTNVTLANFGDTANQEQK